MERKKKPSKISFGSSINDWDEITSFRSGEDDEYIVEYILMDDGGFCHRASPFLMPVGTIFEHDFGTYKVWKINRKQKHIVVICTLIAKGHDRFDQLFALGKSEKKN